MNAYYTSILFFLIQNIEKAIFLTYIFLKNFFLYKNFNFAQNNPFKPFFAMKITYLDSLNQIEQVFCIKLSIWSNKTHFLDS